MQINVNYDPSVTTAPAGFTGAVNAAVQLLDLLFSDPITINLQVGWGEVNGQQITNPNAIAQSQANWVIGGDYGQVVRELADDEVSPNDHTSVNALPLNDPAGPGAFAVTQAQAKALGFQPGPDWNSQIDGWIGLKSNPTFTGGAPATWNFSTNNVGVPGTYNAVGVLVHEVTEVMGRINGLGQLDSQDGNIGEYSILDLFRYTTNSAGQIVHALTPGPGNFSFDGRTLLTTYNDPTVPPPGDAADWASSVQNDDFGAGGSANFLGAFDIKEMDVIGYDLAPQNVSTALQIYSLDSGLDPSGNYLGPTGNQALRLSVFDTAANVSQNLDALLPAVKNAEIGSISLTDSPILHLTGAQLARDVAILGAIQGPISLTGPTPISISVSLSDSKTIGGVGVPELSFTVPANVQNVTVTGSGDIIIDATQSSLPNVIEIDAGGNHTIETGLDDNTVKATAGTNTLDYSWDKDRITVDLQTGNVAKTFSSKTTLYTVGTDTISGVQNFVGSADDDTFYSDAGFYSFDGGGGNNTIDYSFDSSGVTVDLQSGEVLKKGFLLSPFGKIPLGTDHISHIQNFVGSTGDDTFVSNYGSFIFFGGGGGTDSLNYSWDRDAIVVDVANGTVAKSEGSAGKLASGGTDTFYGRFSHFTGGPGGAIFISTDGLYTFDGAQGSDNTLDESSVAHDISFDLGKGVASKGYSGGADIFSNIQTFLGGSGSDTIYNAAGAHSFNGGGGVNTAVLHGAHSEYSITSSLGSDGLLHTTVVDQGGAGDGPIDLTNVQWVKFSDQPLLTAAASDMALPAVAVEASMYGLVGSSAEITKLITQFLPAQVENAIHNGLNPQVYAGEVLGLAFAFGDENGGTAFATHFGPSNAAMTSTAAGDAAFTAAATSSIFGSAANANTPGAILSFVSNWESYYASHGVPGLASATHDQIVLAARGAAWGDAVGVALANNLGPLPGQVINFLEDAAQGTAIYSASLASQPTAGPFQAAVGSAIGSAGNYVELTGFAAPFDHILM